MDKRLKILLEEVKGSDPNLDTMDRNTRVRAGIYQYLGFTEEELTTEQFKNGLKNAILAYKDGPIA